MTNSNVVYSAFMMNGELRVRKTNICPNKIRDYRKLSNRFLLVASSYNFAIVFAHMLWSRVNNNN